MKIRGEKIKWKKELIEKKTFKKLLKWATSLGHLVLLSRLGEAGGRGGDLQLGNLWLQYWEYYYQDLERERTAIKVKQKHENLLRPRDWLSPTGRPAILMGQWETKLESPAPPVIWHHTDKPGLPRSDLFKHLPGLSGFLHYYSIESNKWTKRNS